MERSAGLGAEVMQVRDTRMWKWLRTFAITGWLITFTMAFLVGDDLVRGYGTAWAAVCALIAWYYTIGMVRFSRAWRREIGAVVFILVAQIAMIMTAAWVNRVFLSPPANPNVGNAILYIDLAWTLFWLSAIFTARQVVARRKLKEHKA